MQISDTAEQNDLVGWGQR